MPELYRKPQFHIRYATAHKCVYPWYELILLRESEIGHTYATVRRAIHTVRYSVGSSMNTNTHVVSSSHSSERLDGVDIGSELGVVGSRCRSALSRIIDDEASPRRVLVDKATLALVTNPSCSYELSDLPKGGGRTLAKISTRLSDQTRPSEEEVDSACRRL